MHIINEPSLKKRTTFKIGGIAHQEIVLTSNNSVDSILTHLQKEGLPCYILGGGSNILASDTLTDIILLRSAQEATYTLVENTDTNFTITVPSNMPLQKCIVHILKMGGKGLESLAGIPGTVGGAIAMNAGSFGTTVTDFLTHITALSFTQGICTYTAQQWSIGYRHFLLPEKDSFILDATFTFSKEEPTILQKRFKEYLQTKRMRQPVHAYSAGCVFKNPAGMSAGKLLETAGVKKLKTKNCWFSEQHANFLLNNAKGTFDEAFSLLCRAHELVLAIHGISLELEVRLLTPQTTSPYPFATNFFPIQY